MPLSPVTIIMGILALVFLVLIIILIRRKKTGFVLILLLLAAVAGYYAYKEYNRGNKDMADARPDFKVSQKELIGEYSNNDSIADKKYLGKIIEVEGNVKTIEKDESGNFTIVLGDTTTSTSIRCSIDTVHQQDAARLKEGSSAALRGTLTGFKKNEMDGISLGADVELNRCAVVFKEGN